MKCIILLASPGAGKGTASDYIENKYNFKHISSGSLLRKEALTNKEIKSLKDQLESKEQLQFESKQNLEKILTVTKAFLSDEDSYDKSSYYRKAA